MIARGRKSIRLARPRQEPPESIRAPGGPKPRIGLLNLMPDAAFAQTERQFGRLIGDQASLALFTFRSIPRGPAAQSRIEAGYAPHDALGDAKLDALIVTGCEPRQPRLEDEAFFQPLSAVIDWAARHTVSTLFSCLASHAAVLHLSGIRRRPLPIKHSGVFLCSAAAAHPLLDDMPASVAVPHSRWNDLDEAALVEQGYVVLRRSHEVGVDLFVRENGSLFVFLQGHPEYDVDSLAREYRRDVNRFLGGAKAICPNSPKNYFNLDFEALVADFTARARTRSDADAMTFPSLEGAFPSLGNWHSDGARLFRNWLKCVEARI